MEEENLIGRRIKEERRVRGLSQAGLARMAGIDSDTIGGIESGKRNPRPVTLRRLAKALDMEVPELWGKAPAPASR